MDEPTLTRGLIAALCVFAGAPCNTDDLLALGRELRLDTRLNAEDYAKKVLKAHADGDFVVEGSA